MSESNSISLFMSSYPPRHCGIATFTRDLAEAVNLTGAKTNIIAINEPGSDYDYPREVVDAIKVHDFDDHIRVAKKINNDARIKAVCIQHEFGIFNGEQSCHPIPFLDKLKKPSIINFHSVFPDPVEEVYALINGIARRVSRMVVMTPTGVKLLQEDHGIKTPISVIPHGIPETSFESQYLYKAKLGIQDRIVITSFGMVGPGKGYEYAIEGMKEVVKIFPNALYIIVGATHPGVIEEEGELYRESLVKKIEELGLKENIAFHNEYVPISKIIEYIKASDIFVSSNQNPEQITSGTLAYAMGCGRAIVSTPYPHAQDVVKEQNGKIVDYDQPEEYAEAIVSLLSNQDKLRFIEKNNYQTTRAWTWRSVGKSYAQLIDEVSKTTSKASSSHFVQQPSSQVHTSRVIPSAYPSVESF